MGGWPRLRLSRALAETPDAGWYSRTFRPLLELLEDRVQLGDTILGLSAVALWGLHSISVDTCLAADPGAQDRVWQRGLFSDVDVADSLPAVSSRVRSDTAANQTITDRALTSVTTEAAVASAVPISTGADGLAGQMALRRLAGLTYVPSQALSAGFGISSSGMKTPPSDGVPNHPVAVAGIRDPAGRTLQALAAAPALSFDGSAGRLSIRIGGGNHTVGEELGADGFVDVMLDGQRHSSNPHSASFDSALAGATGTTLAGIQFDAGALDTLTLASQHLAGGLMVQAAGATVVTENLVTTGPLAIQGANITVNGALQGRGVSLAASGWVDVNAAGRIEADCLTGIDVAAGTFVNSGQLHADGPSGGQVNIQSGNLLNAGPITADGTASGGNGGQVHIGFSGSYVATTAAVVSASSATGPAGHLTIDGGSTGRLYSSGRHLTTGSVGGAVDLFGRDVVLSGATVDASGEAGGGSVRIGGDFQGRNPAVVNAQTVTVSPASTIRADASHRGGGGRVSIWADRTTEYAGTVSARGGPAGGSGGFIEVSGRGDLNYGGSADAGARRGKSGTLLLDPKNIIIMDAPVGVFPQFDLIDPHPTLLGGFGNMLLVLSNGNVVTTSPNDDFGGATAGAAYLFDGLSGALLSSLVGSRPGDHLGGGFDKPGLTTLSSGNYLVESPNWNGQRGAVTWGSGSTGVSGTISAANSLVGSYPNDQVGGRGVIPLSNGNYVVGNPFWNGYRGAVTWGNGSTGVSGTVSAANSLVGGDPQDAVGVSGVIPLSNGNYVVVSPFWNGGRGAVTWGNGSTGISDTVSAANSLVGSNSNDGVGHGGVTLLTNGSYVVESAFGGRGAVTWSSGGSGVTGIVSDVNSLVGSNLRDGVGYSGVTPLSNGNYVVGSRYWNGGRGAVTWGNGSTGVSGTISDANSLVGSNPNDPVGAGGVTPLSNGNYVVRSPFLNGGRGAATWADGSMAVSGTVSDANSLVGSNANDGVSYIGVIPLTNGNYVVESLIGGRGAATWGDGSSGISGPVSEANSLVGSNPNDLVGGYYDDFNSPHSNITALSNGNYLVLSALWNGQRGALTWGNGQTGVSGTVSGANSLVGSNPGDQVGYAGPFTLSNPSIIILGNGNYLVYSPCWNGSRGAVTWGNSRTGTSGTVFDGNSLVGSDPNDQVGAGGITLLSNGNYVVGSPHWNGERGAVTWGNGGAGVSGTVSDANSLVGSNPNDQVGYSNQDTRSITPLSNSNYVVASPHWNGERGAGTWADGSTAVSGTVSDANSLVGSNANDRVGYNGVAPLTNGNYVIESLFGGRGAATWGDGSTGVSGTVSEDNSLVGSNPNEVGGPVGLLSNGDYLLGSFFAGRGAVTWASGTTGQTLDGRRVITLQNSLVGRSANAGFGAVVLNPTDQSFLARFGANSGIIGVTVGLLDFSQLTYAQGQDRTLTLTPDFVTRTLSTGTAVVLQASNDITLNSPITVSAGGHGGALSLQAGRSIVLNAPITTDNGALNLIANDQVASGVVDTQRDPGNAVIIMAPGTFLNTGSGPLTVELRDGAGLTNSASGAITLQTVTSGSISVINNGPSAGSDLDLGPVTTSGLQTYADPNGTTNVTGNLTATNNSITFNNSVVVTDGVAVNAGAGTVNFAGSGTQTLQSGNGTSFVNFNHTGSGTLQLTSGLIVTGTFTNSAGTFDANGQPVTVAGPATIAGGTYLAGMASQTFSSGLSITAGSFTSSGGPMSVTGGITVSGGLLNGVGTLDAVTAVGGTVAPGTANPGILTIGGPVTFNSSTTLSILLAGTDAGTGYAQLQAGGPIDLGNSTLSLNFGFEPPVGTSFEIVTNTGSAPISNTFNGLDDGAVFTAGGYQFQITYRGGTGGDSVVLTRLQ